MPLAQPESIYQLAISGFEELGASDPHAFTHRILLQDQFLAGHRFACEKWEAICYVEDGTMKFYNQYGVLLKTVALQAIRVETPIKKAA